MQSLVSWWTTAFPILQSTLQRAAPEEHPEATAGTECSGTGSYDHFLINACCTSALQAALTANILSHSLHGAAYKGLIESYLWHWAKRNHLSLFMSTIPLSLTGGVLWVPSLLGSTIWWGPGKEPFWSLCSPLGILSLLSPTRDQISLDFVILL